MLIVSQNRRSCLRRKSPKFEGTVQSRLIDWKKKVNYVINCFLLDFDRGYNCGCDFSFCL